MLVRFRPNMPRKGKDSKIPQFVFPLPLKKF